MLYTGYFFYPFLMSSSLKGSCYKKIRHLYSLFQVHEPRGDANDICVVMLSGQS